MLINIKYILFYLLLPVWLHMSSTLMKYDGVDQPNLHSIRQSLISALDSQIVTDSLYNNLTSIHNRSPLINGYIGAVQALKAKHTWNPYYKIKYLNAAETTFKSAVINDPHNIEIRFMRFSIEHYVPGFLGYNKNLIADKDEIIKQVEKKYYAQADKPLVKTIISFLIASNRCSPAQVTNLKQHLTEL